MRRLLSSEGDAEGGGGGGDGAVGSTGTGTGTFLADDDELDDRRSSLALNRLSGMANCQHVATITASSLSSCSSHRAGSVANGQSVPWTKCCAETRSQSQLKLQRDSQVCILDRTTVVLRAGCYSVKNLAGSVLSRARGQSHGRVVKASCHSIGAQLNTTPSTGEQSREQRAESREQRAVGRRWQSCIDDGNINGLSAAVDPRRCGCSSSFRLQHDN